MSDALPGPPRARAILVEVSAQHGVDPLQIISPKRTGKLVAARHEVWQRLRDLGWDFSRIARYTGHNHATVMSALNALACREGKTTVTAEVTGDVRNLIAELALATGQSFGATLRSLIVGGLAARSKSQGVDARIVRLQQSGEFDTAEISRIVGVPEAAVANTIHSWREMRRAEA